MNTFMANMILQRIESEMRPSCRVVDRVRKKGYGENFEYLGNLLICQTDNQYYQVKEFDVVELWDLEDRSGALKGLFLLALRHRVEGRKGICLTYLSDYS